MTRDRVVETGLDELGADGEGVDEAGTGGAEVEGPPALPPAPACTTTLGTELVGVQVATTVRMISSAVSSARLSTWRQRRLREVVDHQSQQYIAP